MYQCFDTFRKPSLHHWKATRTKTLYLKKNYLDAYESANIKEKTKSFER